MANNMPFWPSQTTYFGGGIRDSNIDQFSLLSYGTHSQATTYVVVLAIKQTKLPILMPSMIIVWCTSPVSINRDKLGLSQHQAVFRLKLLAEVLVFLANSFWLSLPKSHLVWCLADLSFLRSGLGLVALLLQNLQNHLWLPAAVSPRLWSSFLQSKQ